jgi:hypothetical protein
MKNRPMKKTILLTILTSALSFVSYSQLESRNWLLGGSGNVFNYTDKFTSTNQPTVTGKLIEINLSGNVGYFPLDKFAVGIRPGISSIKSRGLNSASGGQESISIYAGPFARYYFLDIEKQFNILVDGTYQFGQYSNRIGKGVIRNAAIMVGPEIFFNSSAGLEILIGYLYQRKSLDAQPSFIDIRNGLSVSVGFQLHLTNY